MGGRSTEFWASLTEGHAREFFLDPLPFGLVSRFRETICQSEKSLLFRLLRLESGLDQIHEHSIRTDLSGPGRGTHAFGDVRGKGYALPN